MGSGALELLNLSNKAKSDRNHAYGSCALSAVVERSIEMKVEPIFRREVRRSGFPSWKIFEYGYLPGWGRLMKNWKGF